MSLFNDINDFKLLFNTPDNISGGTKTPLTSSGILDALNDDSDSDSESEIKTDKNTKNKELDLDIKEDDTARKTSESESEEDEDTVEEDTNSDEDGKKSKNEKSEDEEPDELAELEDELKERDESELELTTPVKKREILAKYPTIFKDFPSLETAYYRELEFTKIFPTIQDAKDGATAINTLEAFEEDLKKGNTVDLFKAVAKDDPKAFARIADSYMENLAQTDEKAYHHVLGNITKDIVETMVKVGKKSNNKELGEAATTLYQFMFGDIEWKPKAKLAIDDSNNPNNNEREQLNREKMDFEKLKYNERQGELMTGVDNRIKSVIDQNIDKKEQMSSFVKKTAVREVKEKLDSLIKSDTRFQAIVKRLWEKARESKYSRDSLNTIESAHVSKAKSLLPTVIISVKKEALKGISVTRRRESKDIEDNESNKNTEPKSARSNTRADSTRVDKNKPLPNESTLDFLSR